MWGVVCKVFGHKRDGNDLRTVCKTCGVPMVKGRKGWRASRK